MTRACLPRMRHARPFSRVRIKSLPADGTVSEPKRSIDRFPGSPGRPRPRCIAVGERGKLSLIDEILRQRVRTVLVIRLLRSDVEAVTDEWIGIHVVRGAAVLSDEKLVCRKTTQHGLAFRGACRLHYESRRCEPVFLSSVVGRRRLTGREETGGEQRGPHYQPTGP
jgi:hypothetical protein